MPRQNLRMFLVFARKHLVSQPADSEEQWVSLSVRSSELACCWVSLSTTCDKDNNVMVTDGQQSTRCNRCISSDNLSLSDLGHIVYFNKRSNGCVAMCTVLAFPVQAHITSIIALRCFFINFITCFSSGENQGIAAPRRTRKYITVNSNLW